MPPSHLFHGGRLHEKRGPRIARAHAVDSGIESAHILEILLFAHILLADTEHPGKNFIVQETDIQVLRPRARDRADTRRSLRR